jgi:hypothetical protein
MRDVVVGPLRRRDLVFNRGILGRQAEGIPTHRLQHVFAVHAHESRKHVADRVVAHVPHVAAAAGIRKHRQAVVFLARRVLFGLEAVLLLPIPLCLGLDERGFVSFLHDVWREYRSAGETAGQTGNPDSGLGCEPSWLTMANVLKWNNIPPHGIK